MISALAEGKEHVPFRETKLTRLLQDSLVRGGGGGTTGLLVALNPTHAQLNESEGSLQFGLRAVAIRTQQAAPKAGGTAVDYRALCAAQEEALAQAQQSLRERQAEAERAEACARDEAAWHALLRAELTAADVAAAAAEAERARLAHALAQSEAERARLVEELAHERSSAAHVAGVLQGALQAELRALGASRAEEGAWLARTATAAAGLYRGLHARAPGGGGGARGTPPRSGGAAPPLSRRASLDKLSEPPPPPGGGAVRRALTPTRRAGSPPVSPRSGGGGAALRRQASAGRGGRAASPAAGRNRNVTAVRAALQLQPRRKLAEEHGALRLAGCAWFAEVFATVHTPSASPRCVLSLPLRPHPAASPDADADAVRRWARALCGWRREGAPWLLACHDAFETASSVQLVTDPCHGVLLPASATAFRPAAADAAGTRKTPPRDPAQTAGAAPRAAWNGATKLGEPTAARGPATAGAHSSRLFDKQHGAPSPPLAPTAAAPPPPCAAALASDLSAFIWKAGSGGGACSAAAPIAPVAAPAATAAPSSTATSATAPGCTAEAASEGNCVPAAVAERQAAGGSGGGGRLPPRPLIEAVLRTADAAEHGAFARRLALACLQLVVRVEELQEQVLPAPMF